MHIVGNVLLGVLSLVVTIVSPTIQRSTGLPDTSGSSKITSTTILVPQRSNDDWIVGNHKLFLWKLEDRHRTDEIPDEPMDFLTENYRDENFPGADIVYDQIMNVFQGYLEDNLRSGVTDVDWINRQARGKKKKAKKFLLPMILGALLVKSLILPVVLKGLTILSSKAVLLSMISLIVASIAGFRRVGRESYENQDKTDVQVIHVPVKHGGYKRLDAEDIEEYYHDSSSSNERHDPYYSSNILTDRFK